MFSKVLFIVLLSYETDRSRTFTLIAQTIDIIIPHDAVLTAQQCKQNVIKIKLKSNNIMVNWLYI